MSLVNGAAYQSNYYELFQPFTNRFGGEMYLDETSLLNHPVANRGGIISGSGTLVAVDLLTGAGEIRATDTLTIAEIHSESVGITEISSGVLETTTLSITNHTLRLISDSQLQGNTLSFGDDASLEIASGSVVSSPETITFLGASVVADGTIDGNVAVQSSLGIGAVSGTGVINGSLLVAGQDSRVGSDSTFVVNGDLGLSSAIVLNGRVQVEGNAFVSGLSRISGNTTLAVAGSTVIDGSLQIDGQLNSQVVVQGGSLFSVNEQGVINGNVEIIDGFISGVTIDGSLDTYGITSIQSNPLFVDGLTTIRSGELRVSFSGSLLGDGALNIAGGTLIAEGIVQKDLFIQGRAVLEGQVFGDTTLADGAEIVSEGGFGLVGNCFGNGSNSVTAPEASLDSLILNGQLSINTGQLQAGSISIGSNAQLSVLNNSGDFDANNVLVGQLQLDGIAAIEGDGSFMVMNNFGGGGITASDVLLLGATAFKDSQPGFFGTAFVAVMSMDNSPGTLTLEGTSSDTMTIELMPEAAPDWFDGDKLPALVQFEIADAAGSMGVDWDLLDVTYGGVMFTGNAGDVFSVELVSLADAQNEGALPNFDPSQDYTWRLFDTQLGFSGLAFADIQFVVDDSQFAKQNSYSGQFSIVQDTPTSLAIHYAATGANVNADYNNDGVVDAADYAVWRDNLGAVGIDPFTLGDGNGDGAVTITDYNIWRQNFGAMAGTAVTPVQSSVPEPSTAILAVLCGVFAAFQWVRGQHRETVK